MSYLFLSHQSACDALRVCGTGFPLWPSKARMLPLHGDCVCTQRDFARFVKEVNLGELGIKSRPVDILVPSKLLRRQGKQARCHVWSGLLPSCCMLRMHPNVLVSTPEFTITQLANRFVSKYEDYDRAAEHGADVHDALSQLGVDDIPNPNSYLGWGEISARLALASTIMELCGTYRMPTTGGLYARYGLPKLTSISDVTDFARVLKTSSYYRHSHALKRLDAVLPWTIENSASPRETALTLALTLPFESGGFGLPQPELNAKLEEEIDVEFTPDLLWRDKNLIVEYDSKEKHADKGPTKTDADIARANILRTMGYTVLEVTPGLVRTFQGLERLASQIATILGVSLDEPDERQRYRRSMLYRQLFLQSE